MGLEATSIGTLVLQIRADGTEYFKGLAEVTEETESAGELVIKSFEYMATGAIAAVAAVAAESVKLYADFEKSLISSTANMRGATEGMRHEMQATALELSNEGVGSAEELAKAYGALKTNGLDAAQALKAIGVADRFAEAADADLIVATNGLAKAQNAVGLAADDATQNMENMKRVADLITVSSRIGNGTMLDFASAIASAGPTIRSLNGGLEEGAAVIAAYTRQGKDAGTAAQNLTVMIRTLQSSAQNQPELWSAFGMSIYDAGGKMKPVADIMDMMKTHMAGLTDEQKRTELGMLGLSGRTLLATTALMNAGGVIRQFQQDLENAGGATDKIATVQLSTFNAELLNMWHQVQNIMTIIGAELMPVLQVFNAELKSLLTSVNSNTSAAQDLAKAFQTVVTYTAAIIADVLQGWQLIIKGGQLLFIEFQGLVTGVMLAIAKVVEYVVQNTVNRINMLIDFTNAASAALGHATDIANVAFKGFEATKTLQNWFDGAKDAAGKLSGEIGKLIDGGKASDKVMSALNQAIRANELAHKEAAHTTEEHAKATEHHAKAEAEVLVVTKSLLPETVLLQRALGDVWDINQKKIEQYLTALQSGQVTMVDFARALEKLGGMNPMQKQFAQNLQGGAGTAFGQLEIQMQQERKLYEEQVKFVKKQVALTEDGEKQKQAIIAQMNSAQLKTERQYQLAREQLITGYAIQIGDSLTSITSDMFGKQSGMYKAMFAISKAFAIADSLVKIQQAMASAAASLPFPGNLVAVATVAAQMASIVSNITAVALNFDGGGYTPSGARMGGVDGRGGMLSILHPDERVIDLTREQDMVNGGQGGNGLHVHLNQTFTGGVTQKDLMASETRTKTAAMKGVVDGVMRAGAFRRAVQR